MPLFPTQYSTLSASALAAHVSAEYGLPGLGGRYLMRGVSDTYLLENKQAQYILKIYRAAHRTQAEIAGEVELLTYLQAQGTPVAVPLPAQNGAFCSPWRRPKASGLACSSPSRRVGWSWTSAMRS
jgi:Ser/Thr protein kinase RdoA (MazF antagonist)